MPRRADEQGNRMRAIIDIRAPSVVRMIVARVVVVRRAIVGIAVPHTEVETAACETDTCRESRVVARVVR